MKQPTTIKHLACIMDGNRRWARKQGWLPWLGHQEGVNAARRVIAFCLEKKITYLSLYTFSLENFKRPAQELAFLFEILANKEASNIINDCVKNKIRLVFIGDRSQFPEPLIPIIEEAEQRTQAFTDLTVNLLFCYGGRQEIVSGIKKIIHHIKTGQISEDAISDELFEQYLWTSGIPEPDLIIRPGGEKRLSNFLIYQAAYSEIYFLDCLWPELTKEHLEQALAFFYNVQRNYGT